MKKLWNWIVGEYKLWKYTLPMGITMKRLWEWIKGEYKLWKLRRQDPYIYEEDED